jgi:hypothetical protein
VYLAPEPRRLFSRTGTSSGTNIGQFGSDLGPISRPQSSLGGFSGSRTGCQYRSVPTSYIAQRLGHGRGRGFESRRPRHYPDGYCLRLRFPAHFSDYQLCPYGRIYRRFRHGSPEPPLCPNSAQSSCSNKSRSMVHGNWRPRCSIAGAASAAMPFSLPKGNAQARREVRCPIRDSHARQRRHGRPHSR